MAEEKPDWHAYFLKNVEFKRKGWHVTWLSVVVQVLDAFDVNIIVVLPDSLCLKLFAVDCFYYYS